MHSPEDIALAVENGNLKLAQRMVDENKKEQAAADRAAATAAKHAQQLSSCTVATKSEPDRNYDRKEPVVAPPNSFVDDEPLTPQRRKIRKVMKKIEPLIAEREKKPQAQKVKVNCQVCGKECEVWDTYLAVGTVYDPDTRQRSFRCDRCCRTPNRGKRR